jgi:hypothetical protein
MATNSYTVIDENNICTKVILADDLETAKSFLGDAAFMCKGAVVGWQYNPETNKVFDPSHPELLNPYEL